jgi:hypothetical protein
MKNKLKDTPYCNVSKEKIDTIAPIFNKENLKHLEFWIKERYSIHIRKDVEKLSFPWTNNQILKNFRFTNVKRYHDRETLWLLKNITRNSELDFEERIWNSILFRSWNKSTTLEILGAPYKKEEYNRGSDHFRPLVDDAVKNNPDYVWYTNAFNTGGLKQTWQYKDGKGYRDGYRKTSDAETKPDHEKNMTLRVFFMMDWVNENKVIEKILSSKSQQECFEILLTIPGIGPFLSYQIFIDLSYDPHFQFSENEFTVAGPGCKRGINWVVEDRNGLSYEETIFWLRDHQSELFSIDFNSLMYDLPEEDRSLTVMDLENSFCEISKYLKAFYGKGRPKVKYSMKNRNKNQSLF